MKKKYDFQNKTVNGFFEWNKKYFLIQDSDKRSEEYNNFKNEYGFGPDEIWSLYTTIAIFILPRLKYFKQCAKFATPVEFKTNEEWIETIDKMIYAFEIISQDNADNELDLNCVNKVQEGLDLFSKNFMNLWW